MGRAWGPNCQLYCLEPGVHFSHRNKHFAEEVLKQNWHLSWGMARCLMSGKQGAVDPVQSQPLGTQPPEKGPSYASQGGQTLSSRQWGPLQAGTLPKPLTCSHPWSIFAERNQCCRQGIQDRIVGNEGAMDEADGQGFESGLGEIRLEK